ESGIVGGSLLDPETMANDAAGLIARLLRGGDVWQMLMHESRVELTVNWRALQRWGIREDSLPAGTTVVYRDLSMWDEYRWQIVGVASFCILEAGLIVALLVHRGNRRRAEKAMLESQRMLQSIIDSLSVRVAFLDKNGTIIAVNRR